MPLAGLLLQVPSSLLQKGCRGGPASSCGTCVMQRGQPRLLMMLGAAVTGGSTAILEVANVTVLLVVPAVRWLWTRLWMAGEGWRWCRSTKIQAHAVSRSMMLLSERAGEGILCGLFFFCLTGVWEM